MDVFKTGLVRIYKDEIAIGMGSLVSESHVLTCAHVVTAALKINRYTQDVKGKKIIIDFPKADVEEDFSKFEAEIVSWHVDEDIAILKILEEPPLDILPIEDFFFESPVFGNHFKVFGIPTGFKADGQESYGKIRGRGLRNRIQLEKEGNGFRIKKGYSGTLVWDQDKKKMIGMVVASVKDKDKPIGFMISLQQIVTLLSPELVKEVFLTFSINQQSLFLFDEDKNLETAREIFDNLEHDRTQYFSFNQMYLIEKRKYFSFVIHGNDYDYGQRWLLNKIIRDYNLKEENILRYISYSISSGNEIEDLEESIGLKLGIERGQITRSYILRKLYHRLKTNDFFLILKCKSATFVKDYILPFCKNLLNKIDEQNGKYKLICLITIDERIDLTSTDSDIYITESLPTFRYEYMKKWIYKNDNKPMMYQFFYKCYEMGDAEKKEFLESIIRKFNKPLSGTIGCLPTEIPAERFMKKFIKEELNLNWVKFEKKWMSY